MQLLKRFFSVAFWLLIQLVEAAVFLLVWFNRILLAATAILAVGTVVMRHNQQYQQGQQPPKPNPLKHPFQL